MKDRNILIMGHSGGVTGWTLFYALVLRKVRHGGSI